MAQFLHLSLKKIWCKLLRSFLLIPAHWFPGEIQASPCGPQCSLSALTPDLDNEKPQTHQSKETTLGKVYGYLDLYFELAGAFK